ncbi:MAG TPA: 3-oxoacyl-[acyl-carrier-protein] synthase III C-terminal domain-containing protein [Mycobacterium sp.]|nr:3-oxoacyl-[acyl-carrier-protein] synthase III C-terminal domain-containing protein [Mycobacterium sp.]
MSARGGEHWMALEGGADGSPGAGSYTSRFAAIGASIPGRRLTSDELMASTTYRTDIELERLTGVRERHVVGAGEDSYTLALGAARDALAHADCDAADLDMLLVCSISRHVGGLTVQVEPPLNVALKAALGAERALGLDISNACAGMMTGVFLLNDLIRQGRIRRGMAVSGEYISELGRNAAKVVRTVMDDELASLTLGDAGAAAILERAPRGAPGIEVAGFTTLSEHSRLCVAFPSPVGPGVMMHTDARGIHRVATEEAVPMLREVLDQAGLKFDEIDYLIVHQTSARAIKKATEVFAERFGTTPKHVVITVDELGNTASTTHFVALNKYLTAGRFTPQDRVLLLSLASGLEVGIVIFTVDELVGRYGHDH